MASFRAFLVLLALAGTARADSFCTLFTPDSDQLPFLNEIRIGAAAHDATPLEDGRPERGTENVNGEVRFRAHRWLMGFLCMPRPHLGVNINTDGLTSQFYGGFTWTLEAKRRLFIDIGLGFATHNGKIRDPSGERLSLGSRVLFRAAAEPGVRFGPDRRVSFSGFWDHVSHNRYFGDRNQGIDTLGVRFGYTFR